MEGVANNIFEAFKAFLGRDVIYLVSGGTLVGSFLYSFNHIPTADNSWILFTLLGGIGYFLAYAIQEFLGLCGLLPTIPVKRANGFIRWLYERYYKSHKQWENVEDEIELDEAQYIVPQKQRPEFERLVMFQQIGTVGGPCIILSGALFLRYYWLSVTQDGFYLYVAIMGFVLGVILVCLAWLKAAQRAQKLKQFSGSY